MKNFLFFIVGLSILFFSKPGFCREEKDNQNANQVNSISGNSITIVCSPDMLEPASNWANEYRKVNPSVSIILSEMNQQVTTSQNVISIVSDDGEDNTKRDQGRKMLISRNIIVPVINKMNPALAEINQQGISSVEFSQLFSEPEKQNWTYLINGGPNVAVHYYIIDNEKLQSSMNDFINTSTTYKNAIFVKNGDELLSALEKDVYSIGFCSLAEILDANTNQIPENVNLLPIDKNNNGRIDNFENIYENLASFARGVWIGKYPSALCENIYAITSEKPLGKESVEFLSWLTTEGQNVMSEQGLCAISSSEKENNLLALAANDTQVIPEKETSNAGVWIILLGIVFVLGFVVTAIIRSVKKARGLADSQEFEIKPAIDENSIRAPKGLYYDRTHTWAFMEKDGMVKVGIDDFLQHITGLLTRVKMKSPGERIRRGEKILTINRNGKQLDIYSPVTGIIKEQNSLLETDSAMINTSPYTDGWVYSIEPINWLREIQLMFTADKYREWLRNEFSRLKDFFATSVKSNDPVYAHIVLQDGGELTDNVLADLGPEVWEEFQEKFINSSK